MRPVIRNAFHDLRVEAVIRVLEDDWLGSLRLRGGLKTTGGGLFADAVWGLAGYPRGPPPISRHRHQPSSTVIKAVATFP